MIADFAIVCYSKIRKQKKRQRNKEKRYIIGSWRNFWPLQPSSVTVMTSYLYATLCENKMEVHNGKYIKYVLKPRPQVTYVSLRKFRVVSTWFLRYASGKTCT